MTLCKWVELGNKMSSCPFIYKEYHDKNYQIDKYESTANYLCIFLEVKQVAVAFPDTCLD